MTVTVTWMDGQQETYRCEDTRVSDGVLWLSQRPHSSEPIRSVPLANIRIWTTDRGY